MKRWGDLPGGTFVAALWVELPFFFSLSALQGEERCNERHGVTRLRAAGAGNEEVCRSGRGGGRMPGEGRQNALPRLEEREKKKKG